jgi:hypothetical protein
MLKKILLFSIILITGCSKRLTYTLNFPPGEHLRVAVLPFAQIGTDGKLLLNNEKMLPTDNLIIDKVSIISSPLKETPTLFVRTLVQNELQKTDLEIIDPHLIEIELPHHGFGNSKGNFDIDKIRQAQATQICTHLIECDAVLYGTIHQWKRRYYGIESVNSVDVEIILRRARDNSILYQARLKKNESRGLTGGPTGISDLLLEPIRGLNSEIIEDLARQVVRELVKPLSTNPNNEEIGFLPVIYAATHNAPPTLAPLGSFDVLVYGSPHCQTSFRIGEISGDIPLIERSSGHYSGQYFGERGEGFQNKDVFVKIKATNGRFIEHKINKPPLFKADH